MTHNQALSMIVMCGWCSDGVHRAYIVPEHDEADLTL